MLNCKIIADSSADIKTIDKVPFGVVPLKIMTDEKEYCDNEDLDVEAMIKDLLAYKGKSRSACPNVDDWKKEFQGYDCVFCVTITSGLSGSCNSAQVAVNEFLSEGENRKGFVIDSLSTGPESALIIEKLQELILQDKSFEDICKEIKEYQKTTHLIFALESMHNLANNGRVSHIVAKVAGVLGIRIVGKASPQGTLELVDKSKGEKRMLNDVLKNMSADGYAGGKVRIHHCENPSIAEKLKEQLQSLFSKAQIEIHPTGALCSFYAERHGVLIGYEGGEIAK